MPHCQFGDFGCESDTQPRHKFTGQQVPRREFPSMYSWQLFLVSRHGTQDDSGVTSDSLRSYIARALSSSVDAFAQISPVVAASSPGLPAKKSRLTLSSHTLTFQRGAGVREPERAAGLDRGVPRADSPLTHLEATPIVCIQRAASSSQEVTGRRPGRSP